jgi:hypothetical protein
MDIPVYPTAPVIGTLAAVLLHRQDHTIGGGNADGRGTANDHIPNSRCHGRCISKRQVNLLPGQTSLIEQLQHPIGPLDSVKSRQIFSHGFHVNREKNKKEGNFVVVY